LADLGGTANSTISDVLDRMPQFAQPGQPLDPGSFYPKNGELPNLKPVPTGPDPGLAPGTISHLGAIRSGSHFTDNRRAVMRPLCPFLGDAMTQVKLLPIEVRQ